MLNYLTKSVVELIQNEDGPTAVEYAVMVAMIIVVCVTAITSVGTNANKTFTKTSTSFTKAS